MSGIEIQPGERDIWRIVQSVIQLIRKQNAAGTVTLRANQATTTVDKSVAPGAVNVSMDDGIFLSPTTANAAGALATTYVSSVGQGTFVLTHANNAQADKTFRWRAG